MAHFRVPLEKEKVIRLREIKTAELFTFARTFSNEAGFTNEKHIRKTSYSQEPLISDQIDR